HCCIGAALNLSPGLRCFAPTNISGGVSPGGGKPLSARRERAASCVVHPRARRRRGRRTGREIYGTAACGGWEALGVLGERHPTAGRSAPRRGRDERRGGAAL